MSYSQAIETLNDMRNTFSSDRGLRFIAGQFARAQLQGDIPSDMEVEEFIDANYGWIAGAEPYYWGANICQMLEDVAGSVPDCTLTEDMLPTRRGYFHFAKPIELPGSGEHQVPLSGIGWRIMREEPTDTLFLALSFMTKAADEPVPMNEASMPWVFGKSWGHYFSNPSQREWIKAENITGRFERQAQIMAAAVSFLSQNILTTHTERPSRSTRKRLIADEWTHEPLIRVVHLRRSVKHQEPRETDSSSVEWSCQWVVRGHWRLQACGPNHTERRPVFVLPYIKGPEDAPLKASADRVFAVVR